MTGTDAPSAPYPGLPLLVRLWSAAFPFAESTTDGRDVRFINAGLGMQPMDMEIEHWDVADDTASAWFRSPGLSSIPGTHVGWLYFGKTTATVVTNSQQLWASYDGVWHMDEAMPRTSVGTFHAVSDGSADELGKVGRARKYDCASNTKTLFGDVLDPGGQDYTVSAWFRGETGTADYGAVISSEFDQGFSLTRDGSANRLAFWHHWTGEGGGVVGQVSAFEGLWHHAVGQREGTTLSLYVDGALVISETTDAGHADADGPGLAFGGDPLGPDACFVGEIDEVRLQLGATPDAARIKTRYDVVAGAVVQLDGVVQRAP